MDEFRECMTFGTTEEMMALSIFRRDPVVIHQPLDIDAVFVRSSGRSGHHTEGSFDLLSFEHAEVYICVTHINRQQHLIIPPPKIRL